MVALVLFMGCARQMPPPGGPVDVTPPVVVATSPADDSTGVGPDARIRIAFSKGMDRRSVERAIFVSPQPARAPQMRWEGKTLEIRLMDGLLSDRTYVVTVGQAGADEWGNRMAASHTFGFATGPMLNRGEIAGRVLPLENGAGQVYVWAYDLQVGSADPGRDRPAYITQPDADGQFAFSRLGPGAYRIFAFVDGTGDQAYTPGRDALAVPPADISLGEDRIRLGDLMPVVRDTLAPVLVDMRTPDRQHVLMRFDEPVRVVEQPRMDGLDVLAVYQDGDSSRVGILTSAQTGGVRYAIGMEVADRGGNRTVLRETARGDATEDRRAPEVLTMRPERGAMALETAAIEMIFSDAMQPNPVENFWIASDSAFVPEGTFAWIAANRLTFVPDVPWLVGQTVRLQGASSHLLDAAGNALAGSVVFVFEVPGTGRITGAIALAPAWMIVQAQAMNDPDWRHETRVAPGDSTFAMEGVLPGLYRVSGFLDRNGDGQWSPGSASPFAPADPLVAKADTIEVRARWETALEGRLEALTHWPETFAEEETEP